MKCNRRDTLSLPHLPWEQWGIGHRSGRIRCKFLAPESYSVPTKCIPESRASICSQPIHVPAPVLEERDCKTSTKSTSPRNETLLQAEATFSLPSVPILQTGTIAESLPVPHQGELPRPVSSDSHDQITVALLHFFLLSPFDFHKESHVVLK